MCRLCAIRPRRMAREEIESVLDCYEYTTTATTTPVAPPPTTSVTTTTLVAAAAALHDGGWPLSDVFLFLLYESTLIYSPMQPPLVSSVSSSSLVYQLCHLRIHSSLR